LIHQSTVYSASSIEVSARLPSLRLPLLPPELRLRPPREPPLEPRELALRLLPPRPPALRLEEVLELRLREPLDCDDLAMDFSFW
jgi:hypothetical protein